MGLFLAGTLAATGPVFAEEGSSILGKAADFQGKDLEGNTVTLKSLLEKGPVVVDFWATWCKPCIKELPYLQRIYEKHADRGLSVLAVTIDSPKTESRVKPFVMGKKYTFTVLLDSSQEVFKALQGKGTIPYVVIIDRDGNIRYRHTGYRPGDENELERVVEEILAGTSPAEESAEPGSEDSAG
jgi:peroxiredoxin